MHDTNPGVETPGYSQLSLRDGGGVVTGLVRNQVPFRWVPATIAVKSED